MSEASIDVVVPVYKDVDVTLRCLTSVLEHSGARLCRLIVVNDQSPEPQMRAALLELRKQHPAVRVIENETNLGFVRACNRGLALRERDVVILNSDTRVTPGWLDELAAALESDSRVAAVSPLSNNASLCSIPYWGESAPISAVEGRPLGTEGVERFTEMPTGVGFCMLLRKRVLDILGTFDPRYGRGYNEENDWCQRARAAGFRILRANRALVFHEGEVSFSGARASLDRHNARRLVARYPNYLAENEAFARSLAAHAPAIAHRTANNPIQVRIIEGHHSHPHWPSLLQALRDELASEPQIRLTAERDTPDVIIVAGYPSPESLKTILDRPAHLIHAPYEIVELEGRPLGPAWSTVQKQRGVSYALWASGAVVLQSKEELDLVSKLIGATPTNAWIRPWPMQHRTRVPSERSAIGIFSSRITSAEVSHVLEAWYKVRPLGMTLRLSLPVDRIPAPWRPRLEKMGVRHCEPQNNTDFLDEVAGILVAPSDSMEGIAVPTGIPIQKIETHAAAAIAALMRHHDSRSRPDSQTSWHDILLSLTWARQQNGTIKCRLLELLS